MLKVLFWNLNRRPLGELLAKAAAENDVDILLLAECRIPYADMVLALNNGNDGPTFVQPQTFLNRITVYTRLPQAHIRPVFDSKYMSVWNVEPVAGPTFLVSAVHFPSKKFKSIQSQSLFATRVLDDIERCESEAQHNRTVVIGDFNMNPFEPGMAAAGCFHGMVTRTLAELESRKVSGKSHKFWYNPMWRRYGEDPPGTYFRVPTEEYGHHWNMFDQILIRPALLPYIDEADIRIVSNIAGRSLLKSNGVPNKAFASDHLPLFFGVQQL